MASDTIWSLDLYTSSRHPGFILSSSHGQVDLTQFMNSASSRHARFPLVDSCLVVNIPPLFYDCDGIPGLVTASFWLVQEAFHFARGLHRISMVASGVLFASIRLCVSVRDQGDKKKP